MSIASDGRYTQMVKAYDDHKAVIDRQAADITAQLQSRFIAIEADAAKMETDGEAFSAADVAEMRGLKTYLQSKVEAVYALVSALE